VFISPGLMVVEFGEGSGGKSSERFFKDRRQGAIPIPKRLRKASSQAEGNTGLQRSIGLMGKFRKHMHTF